MFSTKKIALALASVFLIAGIGSTAMAQDVKGVEGSKTLTFKAATEKSQIKFVSEAPQEKIVGTAAKIQGKIKMDFDNLANTKGTIEFPVATMKTGNDTRDEHLRSADWLNAEKNPTISFEVKSLKGIEVKANDDKKAVFTASAVGAVKVNGKAAATDADIVVSFLKGKGKVKVEIKKLNIALDNHDVAGKKGVVGAKVGKTIEVTGVLYGKAN